VSNIENLKLLDSQLLKLANIETIL